MRICDVCGKNEATLLVRQLNKDGKATDLAVCLECARKKGFTAGEELKVGAAEVLKDLQRRVEDRDQQVVCSYCGMSFAEFKRLGRLGCAGCWSTFREQLEPLLRRLHSSVRHIGKTPNQGRKRAQERLLVQRLRAELETAIKAEDYERAATLRDLLRKAGDETGT